MLRIFREFGEPTLDGVSTEARHLFVTYPSETAAAAAVAALHGRPSYDDRLMTVKFAEAGKLRQEPAKPQQALRSAEACGVPGLVLYPDFVSAAEEQVRGWPVHRNSACVATYWCSSESSRRTRS